jgi:hypothetical protein
MFPLPGQFDPFTNPLHPGSHIADHPFFLELLRQSLTGRAPLPNVWLPQSQSHNALGRIAPDPPKRHSRPKKAADDKSKKKAASVSSDFEGYADNYVPKDLIENRTVLRTNRPHVNYADDMGGDSDDDFRETANQRPRIEPILMSGAGASGFEYLVRLPGSPPAIAEWINEDRMRMIANSAFHMKLFSQHPPTLDDASSSDLGLQVIANAAPPTLIMNSCTRRVAVTARFWRTRSKFLPS